MTDDAPDFDELFKPLVDAQDVEAIVLKAHLMLEELLVVGNARKVLHPEALDDVRLGFRHKLAVFLALHDLNPEVGAAIKKLNKLRNDLAHSLSNPDLQQRLRNFNAEGYRVFRKIAGPGKITEPPVMSETDLVRFKAVIVGLHGYLSAAAGNKRLKFKDEQE